MKSLINCIVQYTKVQCNKVQCNSLVHIKIVWSYTIIYIAHYPFGDLCSRVIHSACLRESLSGRSLIYPSLRKIFGSLVEGLWSLVFSGHSCFLHHSRIDRLDKSGRILTNTITPLSTRFKAFLHRRLIRSIKKSPWVSLRRIVLPYQVHVHFCLICSQSH